MEEALHAPLQETGASRCSARSGVHDGKEEEEDAGSVASASPAHWRTLHTASLNGEGAAACLGFGSAPHEDLAVVTRSQSDNHRAPAAYPGYDAPPISTTGTHTRPFTVNSFVSEGDYRPPTADHTKRRPASSTSTTR